MCGTITLVRDAAHAAGNEVESAMEAELLALRKDQMHAKADAQCRNAGTDSCDEWLDEAEILQVLHRVAKCANTGQDQLLGLLHHFRIGSHLNVVAQTAQRVLDAAEVVQLVIDYGNHGS